MKDWQLLCSIQVYTFVIFLKHVFNQGGTLLPCDMFAECWGSEGYLGLLTQGKKKINWLHLGQRLEKMPVLLRGSGPSRNSRDEKSEKFQDGVWLNVKKQILWCSCHDNQGVWSLWSEMLFLLVPLSEINVPEHSWSFGVTRGDEALPAEPFPTALLSPAETTSTRQCFCHCWISPGRSLLWLGQMRSQVSPGSGLSCCPCLEQAPGSNISLCHGSCSGKGTACAPMCKQGKMWGQDGIIRTLPLLRVFSFRHLVSCLFAPIFEFMPRNLYCSKAMNDFDVFPLIHTYFFFWKALKYFLIIFLLLEKRHKWQNWGGKLPPLIT